MVHFPGFARTRLCIYRAVIRFYRIGFPHSEIPGSMPTCGSPRLIAACHVLHRLLLPRHPPCALSSLTTKFTQLTSAFQLIQDLVNFMDFMQRVNGAPRGGQMLRRMCQLIRLSKNVGSELLSRSPYLELSLISIRAPRSWRGVQTANRNKKPGVERRANSPAKGRVRAMLDKFLSGIRT